MKSLRKISFLTFMLSIVFVNCTHTNKETNTQKAEIIDTLGNVNKTNNNVVLQNNKINFETPINLFEVKNKYKKYSTSTILNKKLTNLYYKPDTIGFYGQYNLVEDEKFTHAGLLTVYNNEKPWNFENTSDRFIEVVAEIRGIYVFDSIEVGINVQDLIKCLGEPEFKRGNYFIYHDSKKTVAIFKIINEKVEWFKVGHYNLNTIQNINNDIKYLLKYNKIALQTGRLFAL